MRHDQSLRHQIAERVGPLLERVEAKVRALGPNLRVAEFERADTAAILADLAEIRLSCSAVREFEPMLEAVGALERVLETKGEIGGLLLQSVSTFKSAIRILGNGSRSAELLPKLLKDLASALLEKQAASNTENDLFLRDEDKLFLRLDELCSSLACAPDGLQRTEMIDEFFRCVHTIKGNASAFGFETMAEFAQALETFLSELRSRRAAGELVDPDAAFFLLRCCDSLKRILQSYRTKSRVGDIAEERREIENYFAKPIVNSSANVSPKVEKKTLKATQPLSRFFLAVRITGRRFLIPTDSVSEVVRNPQIMAIPNPREGWLGVIRLSSQSIVPLLNPSAVIHGGARSSQTVSESYAVILAFEGSRFSLPVEEVEQVVEFDFGDELLSRKQGQPTIVLDIPGMVQSLGNEKKAA